MIPKIDDSGLVWSIRESFVRYVRNMSDGACGVSEGAGELPRHRFRFPLNEDGVGVELSDSKRLLRFSGCVNFTGHYGMLGLLIADPWIELRPRGAVLSIVDPSYLHRRERRIDLAAIGDLDVKRIVGSDASGFEEILPRLTETGSQLFNDVYPPGDALDPLSVVLPARD